MSACHLCAAACGGQKRASAPQRRALQSTVSCRLNETLVLWKSSKCSSPPSRDSSLVFLFRTFLFPAFPQCSVLIGRRVLLNYSLCNSVNLECMWMLILLSLFHRGFCKNSPTQAGWSPLHIAASAGRDEIVKALLVKGAHVNAVNQNGCTPLHYAASKNRHEVWVSPCGGFLWVLNLNRKTDFCIVFLLSFPDCCYVTRRWG